MDAREKGGVTPGWVDLPRRWVHRSSPMADFFAPYHALTPPARLVAVACGVVYPHSLTSAQLARVLMRPRFRHERRQILHRQYKASCKDVIAAGIIHDTGYRGKLIATGYWAPWPDAAGRLRQET